MEKRWRIINKNWIANWRKSEEMKETCFLFEYGDSVRPGRESIGTFRTPISETSDKSVRMAIDDLYAMA